MFCLVFGLILGFHFIQLTLIVCMHFARNGQTLACQMERIVFQTHLRQCCHVQRPFRRMIVFDFELTSECRVTADGRLNGVALVNVTLGEIVEGECVQLFK
uniref:Uncharacterized protein n=1 Tax=Cacopsylla melanoneura TaxID=428564 RepID=A0A8D8U167_9HEMI